MAQYELNIRDYLRIFRKRRLIIILTFVAVTLISMGYLSTQPVIYQTSTTVKIEERKTIAGLLTEWIVYNPADIMESQTKIIKGYPIMKKVAVRLGAINKDSSVEEVNNAIARIQGAVETERVGQTNMIRIIATCSAPKEAMDIANATAETYIEENLLEKNKQFRHARQFIEEQLTSLETRMKSTEEKMKGFQDQVRNIKMAEPIEKKLVELEFELAELMQKYTEKHPRVIQLREEIRDMENQLQGFSGQEIEYARLSRETEVNKKLYAMLKEKLEEARITEAQRVGDVSIVDPAVLPGAPISTNKNVGIAIGALMGGVLGVVFAFVLETLDTSIATIEDVENTMKMTVLGTVPSISQESETRQGIFSRLKEKLFPVPKTDAQERFIHLIGHYRPKSLAAEAFRNIRTNLKLDHSKKVILVTSSNPKEGKSTIVTNLGIAMAQMSARVLLVSADLRRPSLARVFGVKRDPGLTELLSGAVSIDQALRSITDVMLGDMQIDEIINRPPGLENVWVLTSGRLPSNPAEILEMKQMPELLNELKRRFDIVIFDSPPVLPVTDASLLAPKMDCVIVVYEIGRTSREALQRTKIQLESVGAKIAGIILNNTRSQTDSMTGYYRYQSKYAYYGRDDAQDKKEQEPGSA